MAKPVYVFISSKMVELRQERQALEAFLPTLQISDLIRLQAWIFENDATASVHSIRETYMEALARSDLYLGIFWNQYGEWTIDEFERAGELGIDRLIFVKDVQAEQREPRLAEFLARQGDVRYGITASWFKDVDDLLEQVARAVEKWYLDRELSHHSATSVLTIHDPRDLHERPKKLIGRDALVAEVLEVLDDGEPALLHGFGGMGKSALAATIAGEWMEAHHKPVIWVKAGNASSSTVFEAIGRAFGEQQRVSSAVGDEQVYAVRHILREQDTLLVLDDVWNGHTLAQMEKAARDIPLLLTSRQRFPIGELFDVGALQPNEALELLCLHLSRRNREAAANDPAALQLCDLLGYHAFALEIASKQMKADDLSPTQLLERIENAPHDLKMPANYGELGRTGIKPLLDASIDALSQAQHDLFVLLGGMFEPSATEDLMERIAGWPAGQVGATLEALETRGLISAFTRQQLPYYRLHDLAYSYARTMFNSKGLSHEAMVLGCLDYTAAHRNDLPALDIEHGNLIEAAELAANSGMDEVLLGFMGLLAVEGPYFAARGHNAATLQLMQKAITCAKARQNLLLAHYLLSKLGNAYADLLGDLEAALDAYKEALLLAEQLGDPRRQAILLTVIGTVRFRQGAADADDYHQRAEAIAMREKDDQVRSQVLHNRGYQAHNRVPPDYELGRKFSGEAAALAQTLGLTHIHFFSLLNRGSDEQELQDYKTALATHQEAYDLAEAQNNLPWMAHALTAMGEDYHQLGQREDAQQVFDRSLKFWQQSGAVVEANNLMQYMRDKNYLIKEHS